MIEDAAGLPSALNESSDAHRRDDLEQQSPHTVRVEIMRMWWRNLTFIHWEVDPAAVQTLLPDGLRVDTLDGKTWVALVPFEMQVMLPGGVPIPLEGRFPETNVRCYVRGPDGTPGVWFHSLEAGRLPATAAARLSYGLPYFWADMSATSAGPIWTYRSRRRWPKPRGVTSEVAVEISEPIPDREHSDVEVFLTGRWGLFSTFRSRLVYAPVQHGIWPLHRAHLLHLDDELVAAAGYDTPTGTPLVHWTPGTEVRIGRPRLLGRSAS